MVEAAPGTPRGPGLALPRRQNPSGSGMAGTALPVCLLLAAALQGGLTQGPGARPGPLLLRLRRLEEQFQRLQEVTLSHLQSIAGNYNISYNIDGRFRALAEQAEAATAARAALGAELARLATAGRRLHRRLKRLEGTVGALSPPHRLLTHPLGAPVEAGTKTHSPLGAARSWGNQREPDGWVAPSTPSPRRPKARKWQQRRQQEGHWRPVDAGHDGATREDAEPTHSAVLGAPAVALVLPTVTMVPQEQPPGPQQPGEGRYRLLTPAPSPPACHTAAVLFFPNTSAEHVAILGLGPRRGLRALSVCAWVATPAPCLGALLSYTTEDSGSELAVRGCGRDLPGSTQFVIGDGHLRELPVTPLLDGEWHHFCLTWSSGQGQYRFYVDRRLLAAGSGFRQGYEVPAGGSLVLGGEQDHPGRDFSTAAAFVGHLAGFALWSRALLPGEVASMAIGRGLPRNPLLTLADASLRGGVRRVVCPCLQHCL
ncbi:pentraxin-4 [Melopsittacus undulatus]|uniref:Pentraxin (PTX) domain-containing protein n=1 Tax=Melopsittacus undulatus TaxID=13146 RepID=A0A8V5FSP6_MELUD|nr:pentraxin-4 [Melopsittacus undulatus]